MPLSRSFKRTVKDRAARDARFRAALFSEGVETLLGGDVQTAKSLLRDYINATVGFEDLARRTGTPPKSLMRMFSKAGNPSARKLAAVFATTPTQFWHQPKSSGTGQEGWMSVLPHLIRAKSFFICSHGRISLTAHEDESSAT
ncbi:hypothetical protein BH10PSE11_BH10PSE11_17760 [soil metagenome]